MESSSYRAERELAVKPQPRVRLNLETLEDRTAPATFSGTVSGVAYLNALGSQMYNPADAVVPGVVVNLTGTTTAQGSCGQHRRHHGQQRRVQFSKRAAGNLSDQFVFGSGLDHDYVDHRLDVRCRAGESVAQNLGFAGGINPQSISMLLFLTTSSPNNLPFAPPGSGQSLVNPISVDLPVVSNAIENQNVDVNSADTQIDLAGHFSDPDITNSQVTFNITNAGVPESLDVTLFDTTAPETVDNFLDYVAAGDYNDAIFSRLVSGFVLQGGGVALNAAGNNVVGVTARPAIPNEFGASNTADTLAMALSSGNPNSATNQFFFNLVNNSSNLDAQKFTVFGQLSNVTSDLTLANLATTTVKNESSSSAAAANPTVDFSDIPLSNYTGTNFPTDATSSNYMVINSITVDQRNDFLTYSATSSNPNLVTASINNEWLTLSYAAGKTGSATINVIATNRYGATVDQSFVVAVAPTAPVVNSVAIAVDNAATPTTLTATPTGTDPQGEAITYAYQWLHNGQNIAGATSAVLTLSQAGTIATGDTFKVQVTPSDSALTGTAFTSNAVTVATGSPLTFQAPAVQSVTIAPDSPTNATTLTADVTTNDPATLAYQWFQNGVAIANATSSVLQLNTLTVASGNTFAVQVTPSEGALTGAAFTSTPNVTVASTSPVVIDVPIVNSIVIAPDSATNATTLTATPTSTDPQGNPVTYTYQWYHNGSAITGATSATLSLSTFTLAAGDQINVNVTPSDGTVSGLIAESFETLVATASPITFNPPTISSVTIAANNASNTTSLTSNVSSTSPASFTYQWLQNGTAIPSATTSTLSLSGLTLAVGNTFSLQVTPLQGPLAGNTVTSSTTITVTGLNPTTTT